MFLEKLQQVFPWMVFNIPGTEKVLYLTFDDGPHPDITPWLLNLLEAYNARATFFCMGKQVAENQHLYQRILDNGHRTGNHTYQHLHGLRHPTSNYLHDVYRAAELIDSPLFRPPYGKISPRQLLQIKKKYTLVFWDVLSYDFSLKDEKKCFDRVISGAKPGSVIVFHENKKAEAVMKKTLPKVLRYYTEKGYIFSSLPMQWK